MMPTLLAVDLAGGVDSARVMLDALRLARPATSLGGPETLVCHSGDEHPREPDCPRTRRRSASPTGCCASRSASRTPTRSSPTSARRSRSESARGQTGAFGRSAHPSPTRRGPGSRDGPCSAPRRRTAVAGRTRSRAEPPAARSAPQISATIVSATSMPADTPAPVTMRPCGDHSLLGRRRRRIRRGRRTRASGSSPAGRRAGRPRRGRVPRCTPTWSTSCVRGRHAPSRRSDVRRGDHRPSSRAHRESSRRRARGRRRTSASDGDVARGRGRRATGSVGGAARTTSTPGTLVNT